MAWGEVHISTGILLGLPCLDSPEKLVFAIPLAVASHWPLDDLNVGQVAKVYHGLGKGWRNILTSLCRIPIVAGIIWILYNNPILMATAIPAWLVLDHEWLLLLFGRHGYGLHARMWPKWLHGELGLLPWLFVMILLVGLLL